MADTVEWCSRWLRAVTECIWLGKSLADRLNVWLHQSQANHALLDRVVDITSVGNALRLNSKQDNISLKELEEVLEKAGLIPDRLLWQTALNNYYRLADKESLLGEQNK